MNKKREESTAVDWLRAYKQLI